MKNKVILLYTQTQNVTCLASSLNATICKSTKGKSLVKRWIKGVFSALSCSGKNDVIVCLYDFQAIILWWITRLPFCGKRKIVCVNLLLKDKQTVKNAIASYLYKKALLSNDIQASVTSESYGKWLNKKLHIDCKYKLIHDLYKEEYEIKELHCVKEKTVFCGGKNGRDWKFIIQVAEKMPEVTFDFVMCARDFQKIHQKIPANICIRRNVEYKEFMEILCSATIVCLPLDTEAPAGLIVLFQAAANNKLVITSKTVVTSEYIDSNRGEVLPNDCERWRDRILYYLEHQEERERKACNLKQFLKVNCSEGKYIAGIQTMVNEISENEYIENKTL